MWSDLQIRQFRFKRVNSRGSASRNIPRFHHHPPTPTMSVLTVLSPRAYVFLTHNSIFVVWYLPSWAAFRARHKNTTATGERWDWQSGHFHLKFNSLPLFFCSSFATLCRLFRVPLTFHWHFSSSLSVLDKTSIDKLPALIMQLNWQAKGGWHGNAQHSSGPFPCSFFSRCYARDVVHGEHTKKNESRMKLKN